MGLHLGCLEARKSENPKSFYCFYSFCGAEEASRRYLEVQLVCGSSCKLELLASNMARKLYLFAQPWGPLRQLQQWREVSVRDGPYIFTIDSCLTKTQKNNRAGSRALRLKIHKHIRQVYNISICIYIEYITQDYTEGKTTTDAINRVESYIHIFLVILFFRFFFFRFFHFAYNRKS